MAQFTPDVYRQKANIINRIQSVQSKMQSNNSEKLQLYGGKNTFSSFLTLPDEELKNRYRLTTEQISLLKDNPNLFDLFNRSRSGGNDQMINKVSTVLLIVAIIVLLGGCAIMMFCDDFTAVRIVGCFAFIALFTSLTFNSWLLKEKAAGLK